MWNPSGDKEGYLQVEMQVLWRENIIHNLEADPYIYMYNIPQQKYVGVLIPPQNGSWRCFSVSIGRP
jgi:hypothetical protein